MSQCKIKVSLINEEEQMIEEITALLEDEILRYIEKEETSVILDLKNNILHRENERLKMMYPFNLEEETEGTIEIKEMNQTMNIKIKTEKIERKNKDIEIAFSVEEKPFLYHIEVLE